MTGARIMCCEKLRLRGVEVYKWNSLLACGYILGGGADLNKSWTEFFAVSRLAFNVLLEFIWPNLLSHETRREIIYKGAQAGVRFI